MLTTRYDAKAIEADVQASWAKANVPGTVTKMDWTRRKFYLLDGPPYVNGMPHVGHAKTTVYKDIWGRFKFMQGFAVWFQPGFDCGGLPIENKVEEKLGIANKSDIEKTVGIDKFIAECKILAKGNEHAWLDFYKEIGAWRGWVEPYLTSENYYLESGWWTVKQWYEKGLLVEGQRPGFWCPRCETVLAGIEVSESYKNVEDPSIVLRFPVKGKPHEWLLVFTTTPWTLPANVAIIAHPDETYVRVKVGEETYILAEKRMCVLEETGVGKGKILEKFPGKKLEGMKYSPVLDVPLQQTMQRTAGAHQVYLSVPIMLERVASKVAMKKATKKADEFGHIVTMDVGTGLVHTAPGHGDVDNKIGKHYKLPEPSPVDGRGRLTEEAGEFAGMFVKDADEMIIEKMQDDGTLLWHGKIVHSYPLCWRCKTPLIYRMSRQWFLKMDMLRDSILKANEKVRWLPEFARERYRGIAEEAPDWAVTRQRYWGIPLPLWTCSKCGARKIIGSRDELRREATAKLPDAFDLHKNFVDKVKLKCKCGHTMERDPDIMDVWFDSGISPWASLGYPFKNKELFNKLWDVDLVDESQDQVRAWFNTLMICSFATFGKEPYKTVCLNGWTLDDKGEKMSKSVGNVTSAEHAYKELGADALRLYITTSTAPWETQKFSVVEAKEVTKALNILWNSYNFCVTYCPAATKPTKLTKEDAWLLSRTETLTKNVTDGLEEFNFHTAARETLSFVLDDLSRWYIKLIRDRVSSPSSDSAAASYVLRTALTRAAQLLAPVAPFIAETIWSGLGNKGSIHLSTWPSVDKKAMDAKLEAHMTKAMALVEAINAVRQEKDIKLKWPVDVATVFADDKDVTEAIDAVQDVICGMGNVKKVEIAAKKTPSMTAFQGFSVALGSVLYEEAFIRELTRRVQMLRKENALDVKQRIALQLQTDEKTKLVIERFKKELLKGVGASKLSFTQLRHKKGALEFEGKAVTIGFDVAQSSS